MKLRNVLLVLAAILAGATLLLAGYEVAIRFGKRADPLQLAFAVCAVATAITCLAVLDWARNLGTEAEGRASRGRGGGDEEDARDTAGVSEAEARLLSAVHALDALANEERGVDKTIDEALRLVVRFAGAVTADLWMARDGDDLEHCAAVRGGEVTLDREPAEPCDEQAIAQVREHLKPFESLEGDLGRFLYPLLLNRRCVGVLRVVVPIAGGEDERSNAFQRLSASLARLVGAFSRAACAPGLYEQAVLDALTGLYTRRHFVNRLAEATGTSRRYGDPLSVVLLDVDNFAMLNDRYGAATADRALRDIARLIQDNIREADSAYRYGADEFAILLPGTDVDRAAGLAERLRGAIRALRPLADGGGNIIVSVSGGIAEFDEDMRGIGPLIAHVEEALYKAKSTGHDRIVVWSEALAAPGGAQLN